MKLAWFHGNMLHTHSGGTRFVVDYSAGLKNQCGHEVTVFCDCASAEIREQFSAHGIKLVEMDRFSTNHPLYWLTLPIRIWKKRRRFRSVEKEFDCLINSLFPMNLLVSGFRNPKVQMCYEPFAFFYDKGFMKNYTWAEQLFFRVMAVLYSRWDKVSVRSMNKVLTVNKTNLPKIKRIYGIDASPVYAGIDPEVYKRADPSEIASVREKHRGEPLLFHSTDLTGIKGTYPLLEVIAEVSKQFPGIKVLVTIYVDLPAGIQRFRERVKELGLEMNVDYLGCLDKKELPLYYSSVDFVCQPSINQPANWPLKEAQLCGTPIIGGKESEEADGENGIKVDITDIKGASDALGALFQRDRTSFTIDSEGLKRNYSLQSCVSQFNEIIINA